LQNDDIQRVRKLHLFYRALMDGATAKDHSVCLLFVCLTLVSYVLIERFENRDIDTLDTVLFLVY